MTSEITAEIIENTFGKQSDSIRFASFCNSLTVAEASANLTTLPILSEKPGPDGGIDAEWVVSADISPDFGSAILSRGWNVLQYKARSIAGTGRKPAISALRNDLKGALNNLLERLSPDKQCCRYALFTNLQLGLQTTAKTRRGANLNTERVQLANAIRKNHVGRTSLVIVDAAQLAALTNKHPAIRLTYFSGPDARSWNESWEAEQRFKDYKTATSLIGRKQELNAVTDRLKDVGTKVIVLCGPSGIGKTRLALEVTRSFALSTAVVESVEVLVRTDFRSFGTSKSKRFFIVEDPTLDQAESLAKRVLVCEGAKLILTMPTDTKAPMPKLTEHESIKILPPLKPLNDQEAENLLKAAGAVFDRQALSWIILQAGGNPEILLSAAELKNDLREKSGDLKKRLHERFCGRIEKELGLDGIRALKVLSPLLCVTCYGDDSELKSVCDSLDLGIQPQRILELLPLLEQMGYVRRRGSFSSVVPPLFAARLVEDLVATSDKSLRTLFNNLTVNGRSQFLERMVTVGLPEASGFWNFLFSRDGPLETSYRSGGAFDQLHCLARAVPARTGRFLEAKLKDDSRIGVGGYASVSTLRELAYEAESCASGMRCLEILALREVQKTGKLQEAHVFCECFVDWYHEFPMSFQDRAAWIERLVRSKSSPHRLLGAHTVAFVTAPPQSLSGYTVTARPLGRAPQQRLWSDVFAYMSDLVAIRFELTQSDDEEIAEIAKKDFDHCLSGVIGHVSPDQMLSIAEKFVDWHFAGKLNSDARNIRSAIHWIEERFTKNSQGAREEPFRDKWSRVLKGLAVLRERFDNGDFGIRLRVATGNHSFHMELEEDGQGRKYRYQKNLRDLAVEGVSNPALMTRDVWGTLKDGNSLLVSEFLTSLGECDLQRSFIAQFESDTVDYNGRWRFGLYVHGLHRSDPKFAEVYMERLTQDLSFEKGALLLPIAFIGSSPENRKRLLEFIADKSVAPADVANVLRAGRWLDGVPIDEVVKIMEYIAQGENGIQQLGEVLSFYLHLDKPLPKELFPLGKQVLSGDSGNLHDSYHHNQIAKGIARTNLEEGFVLLKERITAMNKSTWDSYSGEWNPLSRYGGHEFWNFLRSQDAERTYRCFCGLKACHLTPEITGEDPRVLLDLENHRGVLVKIANESPENAKMIASSVSFRQPGFLAFAFELLKTRPLDCEIASCLASTAVWADGFGTQLDRLQAALNVIDAEIKKPALPDHGRAWLKGLKEKVQSATRESHSSYGEGAPFGWH